MIQIVLGSLLALTTAMASPGVSAPRTTEPRACRGLKDVPVDTSFSATSEDAGRYVRYLTTVGPHFPKEIVREITDGRVRAAFVIDTMGRVVSKSARILEETHREFGHSVCLYLEQARFAPIVIDGRKRVVGITDAPFAFHFGHR